MLGCLSPDSRLLALSTLSITGEQSSQPVQRFDLSLWDLVTGRERRRLELPGGTELSVFSGLAFSPDGRHLAVARSLNTQGDVRVCNVATGEVVLTRSLPGTTVGDPAYSADGRLIAVGVATTAEVNFIRVFDSSRGNELSSLAGHRFRIQKLAFSPDGRRLASAAKSGAHAAEIKIWDTAGGGELLTLQANSSGSLMNDSLAFSPDGERLFYIPGGQGRSAELQVWDARPLAQESAAPGQ
jgi:WD40 repeat protein